MSSDGNCGHTDKASSKFITSDCTNPWNRDVELKALRSANCDLQARLSGYLVLRKCHMLIICSVSDLMHSLNAGSCILLVFQMSCDIIAVYIMYYSV